MQTRECKFSKEGWPLGVYRHRIPGLCRAHDASGLVKAIGSWSSIPADRFEAVPVLDGDWCEIYVTYRLSIESYGRLNAFASGWKTNSY